MFPAASVFLALIGCAFAQVPAHNVVSLGATAVGYQPSRSMRNVNPYAKFDPASMQNYRAYSDVRAFQAPAGPVGALLSRNAAYTPYNYRSASTGGGRVNKPTYSNPANPTLSKQHSQYNNYRAPQSRGNFAPARGYTVNAPGFTKRNTLAGPAVHGTNQAFRYTG